TPQPIFEFLQKHGPINDEEAYSNLNMGAGFVLYVAEKDVAAVLSIAEKNNLIAIKAGYIEKQCSEKKVIIKPKGLTLGGDTLKVR
ncbi:MAG: phosphoribosylformylglycinamidine cyclo-ligase, partial [Candidatus Parcubacteria bacterium]|nr:phosphoribosylformylglycinamidine cyclo-ligase [Candidatus Parcubacteria bacterium]